ncbi:hypothetical protein KIW84_024520 [Lathyrus oleraceus]|uniref:Spermatogenesis-associated protein 20-like TRX domain-containing protein n=1 Tax=Pisum sativum TaxID=3888 RepID=A0A9D4YH34_PEA|nr:hypothetical protein KIW84_024520 [Pisum sativum]
MEVESFEDEGIAKLLNDELVSIKVDREERPNVDKVILRKVKEACEIKKEMLVKNGTFAIERLSEALSTSSDSGKLTNDVSDEALRLC